MLTCKSCGASIEEEHEINCVFCTMNIPAEYEKECHVLCTKQCQEALSTGIDDICSDGCILNIKNN